MGIAETNRIEILESQVKRLLEQVEQLSKLLKPATPDILQPRRGRPPKQITGHMQP